VKAYGTRPPTQGGHKTHGSWCAVCTPDDVKPKRARREGKKEVENTDTHTEVKDES